MTETQNGIPHPETRPKSVRSFIKRHPQGEFSGALGALAATSYSIDSLPGMLTFGAASLGILSADIRNTLKERWIWKDSDKVFGYKDTKDFISSPNPGIDLLEKHLGIVFPEDKKPKKIVDTKVNRRINKIRKKSRYSWPTEMESSYMAGVFDVKYNAFFTKDPQALETDLHENMHSFITSLNSDFIASTQNSYKAKFDMDGKQKVEWFDIEKHIAYKYFEEGLSEWAANTTMAELHEHERRALEQEFVLTANNISRQPPATESGRVSRIVTDLKNLLRDTKKDNRVHLYNGEIGSLENSFYLYGKAFIQTAITDLLATGMTRADAITTMIKNPPITVQDIFTPQEYVSTKLLGKQKQDE